MEETQTQSQETSAPKKSFNSTIVGVLVFLLLLGGGVYFAKSHKTITPTAAKQNAVEGAAVGASVTPTSSPLAMQKLQDLPDAKFAYQVFPGALSADAKQALTGFDMQLKSATDGSTQITLVAKKQGYTTQTLSVKPGQSVYFIEKTLFDDHADSDEDGTLHDDHAVVVDSNGYIVSQ